MRAPAASDIAAGEVLLSVEGVSLSFGGVVAIRDVTFDIRKGEVRAIIGPNGAGKTSMLNVINGFYQPQEGRITFNGQDLLGLDARGWDRLYVHRGTGHYGFPLRLGVPAEESLVRVHVPAALSES